MEYFSKILWLGEHTVNIGSNALAAPFKDFSGRWKMAISGSDDQQRHLRGFCDYLEHLDRKGTSKVAVDWQSFRQDLDKGLFFDSDIPVGYGLGSSGALCAAVYDRYCSAPIDRYETTRFPELKEQLAQLESFFHGASSGTDPLICYLDQPVLLLAGGGIRMVKLPPLPAEGGYRFFLLDTRIARQTGPLVNYFLERCRTAPDFNTALNTQLIPCTNHAIEALINGNWPALAAYWHKISAFQRTHLERMIPENFLPVWDAGLRSDLFRFKLCGAGGGGFLLGLATDFDQTMSYFRSIKLLPDIKAVF